MAEPALFVTKTTADRFATLAEDTPRVRSASVVRDYCRGQMLGYRVWLQRMDGSRALMLERTVEALAA